MYDDNERFNQERQEQPQDAVQNPSAEDPNVNPLVKKNGKYGRKKIVANQKRQLEYFKKRRKLHKFKIFLSRIRILLRLVAIAFLVFCFWFLAKNPGWYLPKDIFNTYPNQHLQFEGNSLISNLDLLNAVRKVKIPDKAVYRMDTKQFEREIKKLSPVKNVYVKRFAFPASLKIVIEEKVPVVSIAPNDEVVPLAVFADDGTLISKQFLPAGLQIDTYKVLTYEDYYQWNKKQIDYLQFLAKTAETYSNERVLYIDLRNPDDARIKLQSVSVRLGQLNRNVFKRLKKISAILPQTVNLSSQIDYVDLRWEDSAYIKLKNKDGKSDNLPDLEEPNN
jgi:cell division septal protein FtsQ